MKYRLLAAVVVTVIAGSSSQVIAQSTDSDVVLKRLEAKIDALDKENTELRQRVRNLETSHRTVTASPAPAKLRASTAPALPQYVSSPAASADLARNPVPREVEPTGGIVAGLEGMLIKPYYTGAGAPNVDAEVSFFGLLNNAQLPYHYKAGLGTWLGYVDASGWGGRFRFFDYGNKATQDVSGPLGAAPGTFTLNGSMALRTFDLELTKQADIGDWTLQGFAGVRLAEAKQASNLQFFGGTIIDSELGYKGAGPTAGLEGEVRLIPGGPWSIFFSGRGSLLFGAQSDVTTDVSGLYLTGNRDESALASIWELNVGPQWKTPVAGVGDLFFRVTADAQYWQGMGNFSPVATPSALTRNDYSGGFGLWGVTAAIGLSR
jgi:hypothetical protein